MLLSLCNSSANMCVYSYVEEERPTSLSVPSGQRNAADILMASAHEVVLSPLVDDQVKELKKLLCCGLPHLLFVHK